MALQREFVPEFSQKKVIFFNLSKDYSVLWPGHPFCTGDRKPTLFLQKSPKADRRVSSPHLTLISIQTMWSLWQSIALLWLEGFLWRKYWWAAREFVSLTSESGASSGGRASPWVVAGDRTGLEEGAALAVPPLQHTALHHPAAPAVLPRPPHTSLSSRENLPCQTPEVCSEDTEFQYFITIGIITAEVRACCHLGCFVHVNLLTSWWPNPFLDQKACWSTAEY